MNAQRIHWRHYYDVNGMAGWITVLNDGERVVITIRGRDGSRAEQNLIDYADDEWLTPDELGNRSEVIRSIKDAFREAVANYLWLTHRRNFAKASAMTKTVRLICSDISRSYHL